MNAELPGDAESRFILFILLFIIQVLTHFIQMFNVHCVSSLNSRMPISQTKMWFSSSHLIKEEWTLC